MNNIFKLRKVNKVLKIYSDSFLGLCKEEIDIDFKKSLEKNFKDNNFNFFVSMPLKGEKRSNLYSSNIKLFVNINTFSKNFIK
jgi:hypothetical protein